MPEADLFLLFGRHFNELGVPYMISGSVAVIVYGDPRLTRDVDLVVEINEQAISRLAAIFPMTEFYCPPPEVLRVEAAREQRGHFNIIHLETGFRADVFLAGRDPLNGWGLKGLRRIDVGGETLPILPLSM